MNIIKRLLSEIKHQYYKRIKFKLNNRYKKKSSHPKLKINPEYIQWINDLKQNRSLFVPFTNEKYIRHSDDIKIFAYYLPQFYSIPENDESFGLGFTEWTNVAQASPQFVGHFHPKIPYDLGFYKLTDLSTIKRQVEIAKTYGVYGFCFYYYWFSGKSLLDIPIKLFLNSDIDFHFHFCWANENWSKRWDGGNKEVILEQRLEEADFDQFFHDILPYIKDKRYEKIGNRPMLIIYRPEIFPKYIFINFCDRINHLAKKEGFEGFFITITPAGYTGNNPNELLVDGVTEFNPHGMQCEDVYKKTINPEVNISIHNVRKYLENDLHLKTFDNCLTFKSCFPNWDNSPRKLYQGCDVFDMDFIDFEKWLFDIIQWTKQNNGNDKQYVYINAWNEWAESAILEPTTRYGYKSLEIVKKCIEKSRTNNNNNNK